MENVNARRGFLKGFGLLSAIAAGASAPVLVRENTSTPVRNTDNAVLVPPVDITHLAPVGKTNLTLTADNNPPPPPPPSYTSVGTFSFAGASFAPVLSVGPGTEDSTKNNVTLSVGKDNRLWIKVDGEWKRVALEG